MSGATSFCCDDEGAAGGLYPIEGRGCRSFQEGDRFDVVGVEVDASVGRLCAAGEVAVGAAGEDACAGGVVGVDGVVDGYAVYDHERLVVAGDRGYAAEADIGACAGVARAVDDGEAAGFSVELAERVAGAGTVELVCGDRLGRGAELSFFPADADGCDDYFAHRPVAAIEGDH